MPKPSGAGVSATAVLAVFVADTTVADLPPDVVASACRCLRDSLACGIAGGSAIPGRIVRDLVAEMGGRPEATLLPAGPRVPAVAAVAANSYVANVLDFDDTLNGHPGACVVPAALAVGERVGASGADVVRAIVVGYEVAARIGVAIRPSRARWQEVYGSATYLGLGAAAAAGSLLGMDAATVCHAFGLAGANSVVPSVRKLGTTEAGRLSWAKNNYGQAAAGGVQAALLAARGFLGSTSILDGPRGFWVMAGSDRCDAGQLTSGLGHEWRLRDVAHKPYPCCRYLHGAVDAFARICEQSAARPDDIAGVQVEGDHHLGTFMRSAPSSAVDAQFNLPYVLSMIALGVTPGVDWFHPARLTDRAARELVGRVAFIPSDRFGGKQAYGARVTARIRGTAVTEEVTIPRGHPRNPLSDAELARKFHTLVEPTLGTDRTDRLAAQIAAVAELTDIRPLMETIATASGVPR